MPSKPLEIRMDGLTLAVSNVRRSLRFYREKLGFDVVMDAAPDFGMVRVGQAGADHRSPRRALGGPGKTQEGDTSDATRRSRGAQHR